MSTRLAVVGAGVMGANHIRVAKSQAIVELVAIVDGDTERAQAARGDDTHIECFTNVDDLIAANLAEAVIVATPTPFHHEVVSKCLSAGLHTLVEKPIAATVEEADDLIARAEEAGVVLMVGHVERFNPVIMELRNHLGTPVHIEADRVGPFSDRVKDSVVLDLMIHDLDIVRMLADSEVVDITAVGRSTRTPDPDLVSAHLLFANGVTATITASRIGQQKIRQVLVTSEDKYITADLLRQDIAINKVAHVEYIADGGARYRQTGVVEVPFIENRGEPLALELREFISAIAENRAPVVDGAAGRTALELVDRVHQAVRGA
ncbi:MAG: Gfo/Idh/MocA family oxidoreductase [Microthrixaceae bacterium]